MTYLEIGSLQVLLAETLGALIQQDACPPTRAPGAQSTHARRTPRKPEGRDRGDGSVSRATARPASRPQMLGERRGTDSPAPQKEASLPPPQPPQPWDDEFLPFEPSVCSKSLQWPQQTSTLSSSG